MTKNILFISLVIYLSHCSHNILNYGAVPFSEKSSDAFKNSDAVTRAVYAANSSEDDREVLIPEGYSFTMFNVQSKNIKNVTITINGKIHLSNDDRRWPKGDGGGRVYCFWDIYDSQFVHIRGSGSIDGRGYMWWWREILVINPDGRPHMIVFNRVTNVVFQ